MAKPKEFWLERGDVVEINGRRLKVLGIFEIAGCDPSHEYCEDEKTFYLEKNLALCVSENRMQLFRVERPDENTKRLFPVELAEMKIIKHGKKKCL